MRSREMIQRECSPNQNSDWSERQYLIHLYVVCLVIKIVMSAFYVNVRSF